jgi:hypothetical protein
MVTLAPWFLHVVRENSTVRSKRRRKAHLMWPKERERERDFI